MSTHSTYSQNGKTLLLGSDTRALLATVRSLGRGGVAVHVASDQLDALSLRSRYLHAAHEIPAYSRGSASWRNTLMHLIERERYDLVLPLSDTWVTALVRHRAEFATLGRLAIPSDTAFDVLFSKLRTTELARQLGIPVPREVVATRMINTQETVATLGLPLVLKPSASHNDVDPGSRHLVRHASNPADLTRHLTDMLAAGPVAIQEFFEGVGVGVELLMREGQPLLAFQHERVHEPLRGGGSSYRRSVPVTPDLLTASVRLLQAVSYTGVVMVEFRVNPTTRAWVLLEVNARFWGSLPLAMAAGADFPLALYHLYVDGSEGSGRRYRKNVYSRSLTRDLAWYREVLRAQPRQLGGLAREAVGVLERAATLREHIDSFALDDPRPFVKELALLAARYQAARQQRGARKRLQSLAVGHSLDTQARNALSQARVVLFVCKGNICRSPFAELLARQRWPQSITVSSAGYFPYAGRESPALARREASHWGVDLTRHRSRLLSAELVRAADMIFVFDLENYARVTQDYPFAKGRIHYLGCVRGGDSPLIEDPYGKDEVAFKAAYSMIEEAITAACPAFSPRSPIEAD